VWQEPIVLPTTVTPLPVWNGSRPLEQLSLTVDRTDYLHYSRVITVGNPIKNAMLTIHSTSANAFIAFIDGELVGQCYDTSHTGTSVPLVQTMSIGSVSAGSHNLTLLSIALGIDNSMPTDDTPSASYYKGIVGNLTLNPNMDLTEGSWHMQAFITGEWLKIYTVQGDSAVPWSSDWQSAHDKPVYWYKTEVSGIDIPVNSELMLNATGLNRGHVFFNGHDCGRYWLIKARSGLPTQHLYHIPRDWVNAKVNNRLVLFEELGTVDVTQLKFQWVTTQPIAASDHSTSVSVELD